jgi:AbrB family looped-hinge helix DNA binding protein
MVIKATLTSKGQITIPHQVRERLGLRTGDRIAFVEGPDGFVLQKCIDETAFDRWQGYLTELAGCTTDEVMMELRGE